MLIREINENDFDGLSELYTHLHNNKPIENNDLNRSVFHQILSDIHHHIIVAGGRQNSFLLCLRDYS